MLKTLDNTWVKDYEKIRQEIKTYKDKFENHYQRMTKLGIQCGLINKDDKRAMKIWRAHVSIDQYVWGYLDDAGFFLVSVLGIWLYHLDDDMDENFNNAADGRKKASYKMRRAFEILRDGIKKGEKLDDPFWRWSVIFHEALVDHTKDDMFARNIFLASVRDYLFLGIESALTAWKGRVTVEVPSYGPMRMYDSGVLTAMTLCSIAYKCLPPKWVLEDPRVRRLYQLPQLHVAFINDVASYHKEVEVHGVPGNALWVAMQNNRRDWPYPLEEEWNKCVYEMHLDECDSNDAISTDYDIDKVPGYTRLRNYIVKNEQKVAQIDANGKPRPLVSDLNDPLYHEELAMAEHQVVVCCNNWAREFEELSNELLKDPKFESVRGTLEKVIHIGRVWMAGNILFCHYTSRYEDAMKRRREERKNQLNVGDQSMQILGEVKQLQLQQQKLTEAVQDIKDSDQQMNGSTIAAVAVGAAVLGVVSSTFFR